MANGWNLTDAVAALDRATGEPIVAFHIDGMIVGRFARAIRMHVDQPLAIVLDQEIIATPILV